MKSGYTAPGTHFIQIQLFASTIVTEEHKQNPAPTKQTVKMPEAFTCGEERGMRGILGHTR